MSEPAQAPGEADRRFGLVLQRYGARLTIEQLEVLHRAVTAILEQTTALRAVPLINADEPLPRFAPFRSDE